MLELESSFAMRCACEKFAAEPKAFSARLVSSLSVGTIAAGGLGAAAAAGGGVPFACGSFGVSVVVAVMMISLSFGPAGQFQGGDAVRVPGEHPRGAAGGKRLQVADDRHAPSAHRVDAERVDRGAVRRRLLADQEQEVRHGSTQGREAVSVEGLLPGVAVSRDRARKLLR